MRYTKSFALMLLMTASVANVSFAQSDEDPLAGLDELFDAIEGLESSEEFMTEGSTETDTETSTETVDSTMSETLDSVEESVASAETTSEEAVTGTTNEIQAKSITDRLQIKEIPAGKENHVLYTMPGAIDYKGMTFMRIDSSKFFNRFQKCNVAESDHVSSALSRLKISQGAPLECRESMKYQFLPYKTFRAAR